MVFISSGKIFKCKYCDRPAKVNYSGAKRRHKGYCKTCGDRECLTRQYRDKSVNQKKSYINKAIKKNCIHCGNEFIKETFNQKWCKGCVPDNSARRIIQRYNISNPEYLDMIKIHIYCPICLRKLDNPVIDHNHKTGKVRGIICNHCNIVLNVIEDKNKLERALKYLGL